MKCRFCNINEAEYTVEVPTGNGKRIFYPCFQCLKKWNGHGVDVCVCGNRYVREEGEYKEVHISVCERCDKSRSTVSSAQAATA